MADLNMSDILKRMDLRPLAEKLLPARGYLLVNGQVLNEHWVPDNVTNGHIADETMCMCGSPVADHGWGDNHGAVDEVSYLQGEFRAVFFPRATVAEEDPF